MIFMEKRLLVNDLYQYLLQLQETLNQRGSTELSKRVEFASRFVVGSATELYAESEEVLKFILAENKGILADQELAELQEKLIAIDAEFKLIGGA
jgi:hypothetical protein